MSTRTTTLLLPLLLLACAGAARAERRPLLFSKPDRKDIQVHAAFFSAETGEEGLTLSLRADLEVAAAGNAILLLRGPAALLEATGEGMEVRYATDAGFSLLLKEKGRRQFSCRFSLPAPAEAKGPWRKAEAAVLPGLHRWLEVRAPDADTEVELPGCIDFKREGAVAQAVLLPQSGLVVRWKPHRTKLEATLVFSAEGHSVVAVDPSLLRLDSVFQFSVAQGAMREIRLACPKGLGVTAVRGADLAGWHPAEGKGGPELVVELAKPCERDYTLQVLSEQALGGLPATVGVPALAPIGALRYGGHLAVGTDSALSLNFPVTDGLAQLDAPAFPAVRAPGGADRPAPGRTWFFRHASDRFTLSLAVRNMESVLDASFLQAVSLSEDNLVFSCDLSVEVRDAPLAQLELLFDAGLSFSSAKGPLLEADDAAVKPAPGRPDRKVLTLPFKKPFLGKGQVKLAFELGKSPLLAPFSLSQPQLQGARAVEGYLQLAAEKGLEARELKAAGLREVPLASLPAAAPGAVLAWRFREEPWTLSFTSVKKASGVHCESFHLLSIGEGIAYGSTAVNYFITDASIDAVRFRIPPGLQNVEFVSTDVRTWKQEGDLWTVQLKRKVLGEYNLAVTWRQKCKEGAPLSLGGVRCEGVDSETGYLAVSSSLSLRLEDDVPPSSRLLRIAPEELPAHYMLLVTAPVLACFKYLDSPHQAGLQVHPYRAEQALKALIEVAELHTRLGVDKTGRHEVVNTVTYKIKNAGEQYLPLSLSEGVQIRSAHIQAGEGAAPETVTPSRDGAVVKIPLPRRRNPNEPLGLRLEYSQVLVPGAGGVCAVQAPVSGLKTSFASWTVDTVESWSLRPEAGGSMTLKEGAGGSLFARVLQQAAERWLEACRGPVPAVLLALAAIPLVVSLCFRRTRRHWRLALAWCLLGLLALGGIAAALVPGGDLVAQEAGVAGVLRFEQALALDPESAPSIAISAVPTWRAFLDLGGALAAGALLVLGAGLLVAGRLKALGLACVGGALVHGACFFPAAAPVLAHLLTWGLPACALLAVSARGLRLLRRKPVFVVASVLLAVACLGRQAGAAGSGNAQFLPAIKAPAWTGLFTTTPSGGLESLEALLEADRDCARLEERLVVDCTGRLDLELLRYPAILVSTSTSDERAAITAEGGVYRLSVSRTGRYELVARFLLPKAETKDKSGAVSVFLPRALVKRVRLDLPGAGLDCAVEGGLSKVVAEEGERTTVTAALPPEAPLVARWEPRRRTVSKEQPSCSAVIRAVWSFEPGAVEGYHLVDLSVARGEVAKVELALPEGAVLSAVAAQDLSAWRFDPATRLAELQFSSPLSGSRAIVLRTQSATGRAPYRFAMSPVRLVGAGREQASSAVVAAPEVSVTTATSAGWMDAQDFRRGIDALVASYPKLKDAELKKAFRHEGEGAALKAEADLVLPEIRTQEAASLSVSGERLVYNSGLEIAVAKAGVFEARLAVPQDWYTEALSCPEVSHWEEEKTASGRRVLLHFAKKLLGSAKVAITLSRGVSGRLEKLEVPSLKVDGTLRHNGTLSVSCEKGIRLTVAEKDGVSEFQDPSAMPASRVEGSFQFKMLKPERRLVLAAEVIAPRVEAGALHVARIREGTVLHEHWLRYSFHNAGVKELALIVPTSALGLVVDGPDIASVNGPAADGLVRVELGRKWFDREYPLTLRYERRYDKERGEVELAPVRPRAVDVYKGWVAVLGTERVEIGALEVPADLLPVDPRGVPAVFGARSLSEAAFCYSASSDAPVLRFSARRHGLAPLLQADVEGVTLTTVLSEQGGTMNRLQLAVRVRGKRHLVVTLPAGAAFWSLSVSGRTLAPSVEAAGPEGTRYLVPLDWTAAGEARCEIDLCYIMPGKAPGDVLSFAGPRFDLPLKDVRWILHCPEDWRYHGFDGTLELDEESLKPGHGRSYNLADYEQQVKGDRDRQIRKAGELQQQGSALAKEGRQYEARQAMNQALNYSQQDEALNEDNRVQLADLVRQQAVVGLYNARNQLRSRSTGKAQGGEEATAGDRFSQDQARKLQNSLGAQDSQNLEKIGSCIVELQQQAAASGTQIAVTLPVRGVELRFSRALQVEADRPMELSFRRSSPWPLHESWLLLPALVAVLAVLAGLARAGRNP